ncbi:MAG: copper homeostasis protein CutC [Clostridiaceae bacterium]
MLEIIAESLEDAITIAECGGERIELIQSLGEGGLTPSYGLVKKVLTHVSIPINVMLRTQSKSFHYSMNDIEIMKEDALAFNGLGIKHVVLGILNTDGLPDIKAIEYILENTDLTATFHRAIDESADMMKALEMIKECNRITHILTSGGPGYAENNVEVIRNMIEHSGNVRIIVASGIHAGNINAIRNELDFGLASDASDGDNYDLHVGTGVRGRDYRNSVSSDELRELISLYEHEKVKLGF